MRKTSLKKGIHFLLLCIYSKVSQFSNALELRAEPFFCSSETIFLSFFLIGVAVVIGLKVRIGLVLICRFANVLSEPEARSINFTNNNIDETKVRKRVQYSSKGI